MINFPIIPDTMFRPYRGGKDIEAICDIIHGCAIADGIDPYSTLETLPSLEQVHQELNGINARNAIMVEVSGKPVGYNRIIWWTESDGLTLYLHMGNVLPEFRRKGIGSALLGWSEARIRELAAEHGGTAMFGANASSTEIDATKLLLEKGYQPVFSMVQMEYLTPNDLTSLLIPEQLEILPPHLDDAEKMRQAQVAAYSDIPLVGVSMPMLDETEIAELRKDMQANGNLWRVAWVGDEIASQIWCSIADYKGSKTGVMDEVHTVPKFQFKGIGRLLIAHVILMFKEMGVTRIRLHTLGDNRRGAKTFYEKMGFTTVKTFPRYRKSL